VAVIAIAGPILNNCVEMANAPQWGRMVGKDLGQSLNISYFRFINDFEAASYGLLLLKDDDLMPLNGKKIIESKTRGVIGPGTGLGNSVLFNAPYKMRKRVYVLPSEGGHQDYWHVD
jgi:glucokinase